MQPYSKKNKNNCFVSSSHMWLTTLTHHPASRGQRVYWGKFDTKHQRTVYTKTSMRGWVLEGLWFGSCKFIPIICLQLRPVCTVCLQSGAINVIVRGCSWLKCLSYFSLPGFKWALAGFVSQCFSFPNVNASLDLYQPLYTLPFLSFSFFLDQIQTTEAPFQSETSIQIYVSSFVH